jgi:type IX secretion system substrate protein/PKD domain-containing protein
MLHHYYITDTITGIPPYQYLWNWGDGNTDTIAYPSHTYLDSGIFTICLTVTDSTGCVSTYCDTNYHIMRTTDYMVYINVISQSEVGIKTINAQNEIKIYPNPASSSITILQSTPSTNQQLLITNILGEEIYHQAINNTTLTTIDVSQWSNGVYFYQIQGDKEILQGKFVKQ